MWTDDGTPPYGCRQKIEADERRPSAQVAALLATHLMLPAELRARFAAAARGELAVAQPPSPAALDAVLPGPAPAPTPALAHNLPLELTSFVGRERELAAATALLAEARLLTLTGPGGTGKTRLALRVAREALPHFPDGVRLVELALLADPELIPRALAETLGLQEDPGRRAPAPCVGAGASTQTNGCAPYAAGDVT